MTVSKEKSLKIRRITELIDFKVLCFKRLLMPNFKQLDYFFLEKCAIINIAEITFSEIKLIHQIIFKLSTEFLIFPISMLQLYCWKLF